MRDGSERRGKRTSAITSSAMSSGWICHAFSSLDVNYPGTSSAAGPTKPLR